MGIGGFELGAELVNYRQNAQFFQTVAMCEKNPFCQKVLIKNFPGIPIIEDVHEITTESLQRLGISTIDVICGGFPCFIAGTQILTIEGYKSIESVRVGELVLSHTGSWQKVTQTMIRENAPLREIKAVGVHSLVTTDEHPFYAVKRTKWWEKENKKYKYGFTKPEWTDAIDLTTQHFLSQTLPPNVEDNHSEAFWKFVGLYLADGWRVKRWDRPEGSGRVVISANKTQVEQVSKIIQDAGFVASISDIERTAAKFHIVNNCLYQFLEQFGYKAEGKKIPGWALGLEQVKARAFIEGIVFGDGWINSSGHYRVTTVSSALAYSVALLAQKAYGSVASLFYAHVRETTVIEGRIVKQRPQYLVQITFNNQEKKAFVNDEYGWKRIRQNKRLSTNGTVYNLTVATDNSYIANGAVVHNCQDISVAGKKAGIKKDTRSGLFFELMRVVCLVRPRFVVLENVSNLLANGMDIVLAELSKNGFDAEWGIVSAASVGAVHRRDRVFIIAYPSSLRCDDGGNYWRGGHISVDQKWSPTEVEPAWDEWQSGAGSTCSDDVADPQNCGWSASRSAIAQVETNTAFVSSSNVFTDADNKRLSARERNPKTQIPFERHSSSNNGQPKIKPQFRRENAGVPVLLDGDYLMRHQDLPQWLPKATDCDEIPYRRERLECLGNAIVPNCASVIWQRVKELAECSNQIG